MVPVSGLYSVFRILYFGFRCRTVVERSGIPSRTHSMRPYKDCSSVFMF